MTHVAKVIELVGSSDKGWTEAAQAALDEAKKTIKDITGLEVNDITLLDLAHATHNPQTIL